MDVNELYSRLFETYLNEALKTWTYDHCSGKNMIGLSIELQQREHLAVKQAAIDFKNKILALQANIEEDLSKGFYAPPTDDSQG